MVEQQRDSQQVAATPPVNSGELKTVEAPVTPAEKKQVLVQAKSITATPPKGVPEEDLRRIENQAEDLVAQVVANPQDRKTVDGVTNLGMQAQGKAAEKLELLSHRVGDLTNAMKEMGGDEANIPKQLTNLRVQLKKVNPHQLSSQGTIARLLAWIPVIGGKLGEDLEKRLRHYAARYETVDDQIDGILDSLKSGKEMLLRDNIELGDVLRPQIETQQLVVKRNAYLAELVVQKLDTAIATTEDQEKRDKLSDILYDVIMRAQDLRTMEQVNLQLFVSIDLTIQNNRRLMQVIDRTLQIVVNLIRAGLAIQVALIRQRRVIQATQETQEFASELLRQNAAAVKRGTEDIGRLYKSPVLILDKVKAAHDDLIAAMDKIDEYKREGIEAAREGIKQLTEMSESLDDRAKKLHAKVQETSVEAV